MIVQVVIVSNHIISSYLSLDLCAVDHYLLRCVSRIKPSQIPQRKRNLALARPSLRLPPPDNNCVISCAISPKACTFHNQDGASTCDMCGTPNPAGAGGAGASAEGDDGDGSGAYWSCQVPSNKINAIVSC